MDVGAIDDACRERWFNTSLTRVNDCVVRLGVIEGNPDKYIGTAALSEGDYLHCAIDRADLIGI